MREFTVDAKSDGGNVKKMNRAEFAAMLSESGINMADLTPDEQSCMSRKIKILVGEGKKQDQAVAIAYSYCAPEKSKKHAEHLAGEDLYVVACEECTYELKTASRKLADEAKAAHEDKNAGHMCHIKEPYDGMEPDAYRGDDLAANSGAVETPGIKVKEQFADVSSDYPAGFKVDISEMSVGDPMSRSFDWKVIVIRKSDGRQASDYASGGRSTAEAVARRLVSDLVGGKFAVEFDPHRPMRTRAEDGGFGVYENEHGLWLANKQTWEAVRIVAIPPAHIAGKELVAWAKYVVFGKAANFAKEDGVKKLAATPTRLPGGDYTAIQNGDGTWTIKDVPIFAEVPKGERGNPETISGDWMLEAVAVAKSRWNKKKYAAPLHVHHHDNGTKTERAGVILPQRVALVPHPDEDRLVPAIISDLAFVPDHVFRRIEKNELLYRSVEVADWAKPEIASLALLSDEVPFFKFPNLTIGKKAKAAAVEPTRFSDKSTPAISCRAAGRGGLLLFKFRGGSLMEPKEEVKEKLEEDRPEVKNPDAAPPWAHEMMEALRAIHAHFKIGESTEKAELQMDALDDTPEDEEKKSAADDKMPVEQPEPKHEVAKYAANDLVKLSAQVAALQAIEQKRVRDSKVDALVSKGRKEVEKFNLPEESFTLLRTLVASHGEEGLKLFVSHVKLASPQDPPSDFEGYVESAGSASDYPEEVMAYAKGGADVLEAAKGHFKTYQQLNGKTSTSLARFLQISFNGPILKG